MKKYLFWLYKAILFGLSLLLLTRDRIFHWPTAGLDPSWNIGINLAVANNFTFGRDVIFTYGPLGYLHTRLPIGVTKTEYLLWDLFFWVLFGYVLFYLYKNLNAYLSPLLALGVILLLSRSAISLETLLLPFLFLLFHHLRYHSRFSLLLAAVLSLILFYAKINAGLAAIILMLGYLLYQIFFSMTNSRRTVGGYLAAFLGSLLISAYLLNVYLPGYVWGGVQLATAYNDAMFIYAYSNPYAIPSTYLALGGIIPLGLVFLFNWKHFKQDHQALLRILFIAAYIFFLFKQSFVRADWHILNFFQAMPAAIGLLAFFAAGRLARQWAGVLGLSLVLSMPYATGLYDLQQFAATAAAFPAQGLASGTVAHLTRKYEGARRYLAQAVDPDYPPSPFPQPNLALPPRFLERIGRQTVDVIPWEIAYIYANRLAYEPRPVFQSYQAYNDYLDSQNRDKYTSATAPEYILFTVNAIDNQPPSFIESKTRLALLTHYRYVDHEEALILLQKRADPLELTRSTPVIGFGQLGQEIALAPTDALLMMSFDIQYSLTGYLKRTFYQPPPLYVTLKFSDGEEKQYKAPLSVIRGQVLVDPLLDRTSRAVQFFQQPAQIKRRVVALRFHSPEAWGFVDEFVHTGWRIETKDE